MAASAQSARWRRQISARVLCWVGAYRRAVDFTNKWKKLSVSTNNCFFFFFSRPAHVSDPGYKSVRLGTPNVQIYLTNFEIPCHRWPFTGKGIISMFFSFFIRLDSADICSYQSDSFWHESQGNICGDLFHCCRERENNNQEGTVRLFNVQIRGAVTCLWQTFNVHCRDIIITMFP